MLVTELCSGDGEDHALLPLVSGKPHTNTRGRILLLTSHGRRSLSSTVGRGVTSGLPGVCGSRFFGLTVQKYNSMLTPPPPDISIRGLGCVAPPSSS